MPEPDVINPEGTARADTILVSVPSPDGVAVATALRNRGFVVTEAPLDLLASRALAEAPRVVVADVDPTGAVEAILRARDATSAADLICVGDSIRAARVGVSAADGRAFERPIDMEALVLSVLALAEPVADARPRGARSARDRARETAPPRRAADSEDPRSEFPVASDPLDVGMILPSLEDDGLPPIAPIELSPELAQILDSAERRVSSLRRESSSSIPAPEEEIDLLLSPELLASLDEPLDPDDEASASGASTGGAAYPKPRSSASVPTTGAQAEKSTGVDGAQPARATGAPDGPSPPSERPPRELSMSTGQPGGPASRADVEPRADVVDRWSDEPSETPRPRRAQSIDPRDEAAYRGGRTPVVIEARAAPDPIADEAPESLAPRRARYAPPPAMPVPQSPSIPAVLGEGDAVRAIAIAVAARASGSLALGPGRRIVLREGDIVTAASAAPDETLVAFLAARGDLERSEAARLAGKLPAHGRHAGAALIAHGHLGQDDLWPVLRAHAEWIIGRALLHDEGTCEIEADPPGRLKAEPNVFGGATGAEVLIEQIRRVVPPEIALRRLGGRAARLAEGARLQLLAECALRAEDEQIVRSAQGRSVGELLSEAEAMMGIASSEPDGADGVPDLADVLYGLVSLGVLEALAPVVPAEAAPARVDPLDEEALRQRVRARVALVADGDYFALLGISRAATAYEIRRAYVELRRSFEPARVLTASTADLADDVRLVAEVLDEAYEILREPHRRERYRRAIEAGPP